MYSESRSDLGAGRRQSVSVSRAVLCCCGLYVADATGEDSLRKELRAAISGDRFEKAFDWSQVSLDRDVSELRETLAREEQELFDAGYRAARDVRAWKRRRTARLTTAAIYKRAAPERVG